MRPCSLGNKPGLILSVKEVLDVLRMECDPVNLSTLAVPFPSE